MEDLELPVLIDDLRQRHPEATFCVVAIIDGGLALLGQGDVVDHLKEILNAANSSRRDVQQLH